jgi:hypothetical protein
VEEVAWLVAHRQTVVAARANTGLTLWQLTALRVISAQAPVTRTDLVLGTRRRSAGQPTKRPDP